MTKQLPPKLEDWFYKLGTNNSSQIATAILAGFKMFFIPFATLKDTKASPEQRRYAAMRDFITEGLAVAMYIGLTGLAQKKLTAPICKKYFAKKAKLLETGKIKGLENELTKEELETLKNVNPKFLQEVGLQDLTSRIDINGNTVSKIKASDEAIEHVKKLDVIVDKLQTKWQDLPQKTVGEKIKNAFSSKSKIQKPIDAFKNTRINISQICVWTLALSIIPIACNVILTPVMNVLNNSLEKNKKPQVNNNPVNTPTKVVTDINNNKNKTNFGQYHNYSYNRGMMRV